MPRYHYRAVDAKGKSLAGEIDGASPAAVREELRFLGLDLLELHGLASENSGRLSTLEADAVTQQIATATEKSVPLVGSLRAFSEEVRSRRMRLKIDRMCNALDAGESIESVLSNPDLRLPPALAMIMKSGLPASAMNPLLSWSVRASTMTSDLRARAVLLLSYPILMLSAFFGFWLFILVMVAPEFGEIFSGFGLELPAVLTQILRLSQVLRSSNAVAIVVVAGLLAVGCGVYVSLLPADVRRRIWCGIPIIGSMYRLAALSHFARLLSVMVEAGVPLPQSLTWAAAGAQDAELEFYSQQIVAEVQAGQDPLEAARRIPGVPSHLEQMIRFASHGTHGGAALRSMAQMLEARAKTLSQAAMPLMEPVLLSGAIISAVGFVLTFFPPLIKLLNDLS